MSTDRCLRENLFVALALFSPVNGYWKETFHTRLLLALADKQYCVYRRPNRAYDVIAARHHGRRQPALSFGQEINISRQRVEGKHKLVGSGCASVYWQSRHPSPWPCSVMWPICLDVVCGVWSYRFVVVVMPARDFVICWLASSLVIAWSQVSGSVIAEPVVDI